MLRVSCVRAPDEGPPRLALADELRRLAIDVRRIGCGYRADPEAIASAKSEIAGRLTSLARELEARR